MGVADWERVLGNGHDVPLTADLDDALRGSDCAALVTKHRECFALTPERLSAAMHTPVVVDGRNVFDLLALEEAELVVQAVGKG